MPRTANGGWENKPNDRFYLVIKSNDILVGIFSNRVVLNEALQFTGIEDCYIKGKLKNKKVNDSTIGDELANNKKFCKVLHKDENGEEKCAYRIWEIQKNNINPKLIESIMNPKKEETEENPHPTKE